MANLFQSPGYAAEQGPVGTLLANVSEPWTDIVDNELFGVALPTGSSTGTSTAVGVGASTVASSGSSAGTATAVAHGYNRYPTTIAELATAIGYGSVTTAIGYRFDAASGSIPSVFGGSAALASTGSTAPTYGQAGAITGSQSIKSSDLNVTLTSPNTTDFDAGTGDLILFVVVNLVSGSGGNEILNKYNGTGYDIAFDTFSGVCGAFVSDGAGFSGDATTTLPLDQWIVLGYVLDRTAAILDCKAIKFSDRSVAASTPLSLAGIASTIANGGTFHIGKSNGNNGSTMWVDSLFAVTGVGAAGSGGTSVSANLAAALDNFLTYITGRAVGSSDGTSTATAGGATAGGGTVTSSGTAAGTATAAATGASTAATSGTAAGTATAAAVGQGTAATSGTDAATSTASATGASTDASSGSDAGTATAVGTGASTAASSGADAGTSTATATGTSTSATSGSAAGTSTAAGTGASTAASSGTDAGTSTATGVGTGITPTSGTAAGTATAAATGASTAATSGTAAGTATAAAVGAGTSAASGTDDGTASAAATGASTSTGSGSGDGSSSGSGTGDSTATTAGLSSGTATAAATGAATDASSGTAAGTATAAATGASTAATSGSSDGSSTAQGHAPGASTGSSDGSSDATGTGVSTAATASSVAGTATAAATGASTSVATGSDDGSSTAAATGVGLAQSSGSSEGSSAASAVATTPGGTGSSDGSSDATAGGASVSASSGTSGGDSTAGATATRPPTHVYPDSGNGGSSYNIGPWPAPRWIRAASEVKTLQTEFEVLKTSEIGSKSFTAGSVVRFIATFKEDGRLSRQRAVVTAEVSDTSGVSRHETMPAGEGTYYFEMVVKSGAMTVTFSTEGGARSETTYLVTPAVGRPTVNPLGARADAEPVKDWTSHYRRLSGRETK